MNDPPKRHQGFVAELSTANNEYWIVKVDDKNSEYHGTRLLVASIRGNIALAKGLNVNFCVGNVDGPGGKPVNRAVDVCLS